MVDAEERDEQLDHPAVDGLLVAATQDNELRSVLTRLTESPEQLTVDGQRRLDEVVLAVEALDDSVRVERERLLDLFGPIDVATAVGTHDLAGRPLHAMFFEAAGPDVDRAVATLESAGYRRLAPTGAAQWRAYRATHGSCAFIRTDREPFRVRLRWPASRLASGPLSRLITPKAGDFDAVELPLKLWPAYSLVHIVRMAARLVRRQAEPPDLGPFLQTPDALIAPLLRFAGLQPDDLLVDLGCGDARIPIAAAVEFGARARGVEYDADLVERARRAITASGEHDRVDVVLGDASTADLGDADVVVAFLPVETLTVLIPEILSRLRPGARLVVHEQERLDVSPAADLQQPLISAGGVTVAHRWNR